MKKVFKYTLPLEEEFPLIMPAGAEILCVQSQFEDGTIWALVDPEATQKEVRNFRIYGTGHEINEPEKLKYIGTYQLSAGNYVYHLFEAIT